MACGMHLMQTPLCLAGRGLFFEKSNPLKPEYLHNAEILLEKSEI